MHHRVCVFNYKTDDGYEEKFSKMLVGEIEKLQVSVWHWLRDHRKVGEKSLIAEVADHVQFCEFAIFLSSKQFSTSDPRYELACICRDEEVPTTVISLKPNLLSERWKQLGPNFQFIDAADFSNAEKTGTSESLIVPHLTQKPGRGHLDNYTNFTVGKSTESGSLKSFRRSHLAPKVAVSQVRKAVLDRFRLVISDMETKGIMLVGGWNIVNSGSSSAHSSVAYEHFNFRRDKTWVHVYEGATTVQTPGFGLTPGVSQAQTYRDRTDGRYVVIGSNRMILYQRDREPRIARFVVDETSLSMDGVMFRKIPGSEDA